jgi:hypothetical protein
MATLPADYWNGPHDCSLAGHRECSQSKDLPHNQVATKGAVVASERNKHCGPDTEFCVLCLSGEHERVTDQPTA